MKAPTEAFLRAPQRLFIGGEWVEAHSQEQTPVIDPATEEVITAVAAGDAEDVGRAVAAARAALRDGTTGSWNPAQRTRLLWELAAAIESDAGLLAEIETLDVGKPISNVRKIDIPGAAAALRYFAGWAGKISGETMPLSLPGEWQAFTVREPVGVVGQIIPWNYPLMGAVSKLAPALAAGCAVVLKPAEQTPLSALRLAALTRKIGFPAGVFNVVTGTGPDAGAALVEHPDVDKISFTGSTLTGERIMRAAAGTMKRLTLELGGKSPIVVLPDADIERAAQVIAMGIFINSGQTCSAGSRLLAHSRIAAELVRGIAAAARRLKIGAGMDPSTEIGPVVSAAHRERVMGYIQQARNDGATVVAGGGRLPGKGYFVQPTVIADTRGGMSVVEEEIFGPVLTMTEFNSSDLDEIAAAANSTPYGLAAYVWTTNLTHAHGLIRRLRAGTVRINCGGGGDFAMPVGGCKRSGFGRENGRVGVEAYTELKSVTIAC